MSISDKIQASLETWSGLWKQRLAGWLASVMSFGLDTFFKVLAKSFAPKLAPLVNKLEATGKIPPELKPLLDELKSPTGEAAALLGNSAASALISGAIGRVLDAALLPLAYTVNELTRNVIPNEGQLIAMWLRGVISEDNLNGYLGWLGLDPHHIDYLKQISKRLYDAGQAISLWRRGTLSESVLDSELKSQGYTPERIAGLKKLAEILPSASDIVRFAVREAYTPEIAEKFGQYEDFPEKAMTDAGMVGLSKDLLSKYWAAHWDLPSVTQAFDMLHRGIISLEDCKTLLRALDIMPYWRDKLIQMAYNLYTRVDARRMWDMGIIDDAELELSYKAEGYDPDKAHKLTVWTKVYQTYPDLIARYKNGYINLDDVKNELVQLGLTADRAQWLIEQKIKKQAPERTAKERDLTKAEIIKGLNKNVINEPTAIELLTDMGYSEAEAIYIITINAPKEETKKAQTQKELSKSDIISSLKKGLIAPEDAMSRLVAIRYLPDDAQFLVGLALATAAVITEVKLKEITKADIVKGVKQGLITAEDGYLLLQDIGYSPDSASFILALIPPATGGSPDSYTEFKKLTQSYRASQGLKATEITPDIILAERELKAAEDALKYAKAKGVDSEKLTPLVKAVTDAGLKYKQLLAKLKQS